MKLPISWLRRFVDLDDVSLDELVDVMSLNGLEVEEVHVPGRGTTGVVTKRVVSWEPHPDADKLRVVQVTDGETQIELVCGASNFDTGDVVAHAEVGATIPPPAGSTEPFRLEPRELRGVVSNGMLVSAREIQLGDDHDGIMVLPDDTPLGADLTDILPVGEPVIEVAVLADRGDHHSVLGIARELGAILDRPVRELGVPVAPDAAGVPVDIAPAGDGCSQFVTWTVEGVEVGPSPWWLRQRLEQCGVRAINNVVDVTNFVMLETGQPLHAFDLDRLHGERADRALGRGGRDARHPRRSGAHPPGQRPRHLRRRPHRVARRRDGRGRHRGLRRDHARAARGRDVGPAHHPPHLAPAEPRLRGEPALRAARRPRRGGGRRRPRGRAPRRDRGWPRRRHLRRRDRRGRPAGARARRRLVRPVPRPRRARGRDPGRVPAPRGLRGRPSTATSSP